MQRKPREERERSWWRHEYQSSGKPWRKRTTGPVPIEAMCMLMPLVGTIVCSIFSIFDISLSNFLLTTIYVLIGFFFFFG